MSEENPYGKSRVLSGLRHLLFGKALASIGGVGTLFFTVRGLSVPEFAAYSVLFGLVELAATVTSLGANHILGRFVPELYQRGRMQSLGRMVLGLALFRSATLGALMLGLALASEPVCNLIGIPEWRGAFVLYAPVVFLRGVTQTLFTILEAMLLQRVGQLTFAGMTVGRFAVITVLYFTGTLSLQSLIVAELVVEFLGLCVMVGKLRGIAWKDLPAPDGATGPLADPWLRANRARMIDYGWKGYVQHLIIMPFSGMINRLIVGGRLPTVQVAQFGFAQSVYDMVQRYLPAQLFQGVIRPVMVARYTQTGQTGPLVELTNACLKANLFIIGAGVVCLYSGGAGLLEWLTNGKQGGATLGLLLLMMLLISLESWRHVLDILCQTVERFGFLIISNAILAASLLGGLALLPRWGAAALPAANCMGLCLANLLVQWWLRRSGIPIRIELAGVGALVCVTVAVCALGRWAGTGLDLGWAVLLPLSLIAYLLAAVCILLADRSSMRMLSLLKARRSAGAAA